MFLISVVKPSLHPRRHYRKSTQGFWGRQSKVVLCLCIGLKTGCLSLSKVVRTWSFPGVGSPLTPAIAPRKLLPLVPPFCLSASFWTLYLSSLKPLPEEGQEGASEHQLLSDTMSNLALTRLLLQPCVAQTSFTNLTALASCPQVFPVAPAQVWQPGSRGELMLDVGRFNQGKNGASIEIPHPHLLSCPISQGMVLSCHLSRYILSRMNSSPPSLLYPHQPLHSAPPE